MPTEGARLMVEVWQGVRRVAFIPVSNSQVDGTVPSDFVERVYRRAFVDPDPVSGADGSLKAYIHQVSSGRASLTGHVFPPVVAPDTDVVGAGLDSLPSIKLPFPFETTIPLHGFDFAMVVLPHSEGPHRGGYAWYPGSRVNGVSFYCRTALFNSRTLTAPQSIGVWAMELLHIICRFGDLYFSVPALGQFDVMSCACGTHPTAYTKTEFGWLDPGATAVHDLGTTEEYALSAVSFPQPPPPGRRVAVRVKSQVDSSYFMIEARKRSDIYERQSGVSAGIPSEGVLVYQVRDTTDVELRRGGLTQGLTYQNAAEDLAVSVEADIPGGYRVRVSSRATILCRALQAHADSLRQALEATEDPIIRRGLIAALARIRAQMLDLNCGPVAGPADAEWDERVRGRLIGERLDAVAGPAGPPDGPAPGATYPK